MESVTVKDLQGQWVSSYGYHITVVNATVSLPEAQYRLVEKDGTVEMDGWRVAPAKSSAEEMLWQKEGEADLKWTFEEDVVEKLEEHGIDSGNILKGKRRRGAKDYVKLNQELEREEAHARRERERLQGEQKALEAIRRKRRQQKEMNSKVSTKRKSVKEIAYREMSIAEVQNLRAKLKAVDPASSDEKNVLPTLEELATVKMTLKILTETLIAKAVNPFRKHRNPLVAKKAKLLFTSW
eukprot:CAMPEP_0114510438 /NCGR_PEP_ID=MMETSP0109-20121206/13788_1 /TAXON_ID=29199 /ORGANISM="Chlorarachnion reptans, Strain CCCM449" /LENGTH=238 /DNA_ID=CAMNT_0001689747 /DNA_START=65 /DNA_END=778 /DNA_ORIENTATION=+